MKFSNLSPSLFIFALFTGTATVAMPAVALQIESSQVDPQQTGSGQTDTGQVSKEQPDHEQTPVKESDPAPDTATDTRSGNAPSVDVEPATRFSPSEKIRADDAVSFPVDI